MFRRTADLVDTILRGTKPGDIPIEQPTKFDLVVNLTTAKAIGGSKGRDGRPGLDRMLKDASKRRFDVVMASAIDRLGRSLTAT
jgi:hypothetical protein